MNDCFCTGEFKACYYLIGFHVNFLNKVIVGSRFLWLPGKKIRARCSGFRNYSICLILWVFWYLSYQLEYTLGNNWGVILSIMKQERIYLIQISLKLKCHLRAELALSELVPRTNLPHPHLHYLSVPIGPLQESHSRHTPWRTAKLCSKTQNISSQVKWIQ